MKSGSPPYTAVNKYDPTPNNVAGAGEQLPAPATNTTTHTGIDPCVTDTEPDGVPDVDATTDTAKVTDASAPNATDGADTDNPVVVAAAVTDNITSAAADDAKKSGFPEYTAVTGRPAPVANAVGDDVQLVAGNVTVHNSVEPEFTATLPPGTPG